MSLIVNPENDAPIDNMKLHKDLSWVVKTLAALVIVGFMAGVWATTLAQDVKHNTAEIEKKATDQQLTAVAETLKRIEGKIDKQAEEQQTVKEAVVRLETKVEALEQRAE